MCMYRVRFYITREKDVHSTTYNDSYRIDEYDKTVKKYINKIEIEDPEMNNSKYLKAFVSRDAEGHVYGRIFININ